MRLGVTLLALGAASGCGPYCPGNHTSSTLTGGTGSVAVSIDHGVGRDGVAMVGTVVLEPAFFDGSLLTPVGVGDSFRFAFDAAGSETYASIACHSLPWDSMKRSEAIALADLSCALEISRASLDQGAIAIEDKTIPLTVGMLVPTSHLDEKGNGTLALALDVPSVAVAGARVELGHLTGTVTYGSVYCGSASSIGPKPL